MKYSNFILFVFVIISSCCLFVNGDNLLWLEVDTTSVTIKTSSTTNKNIFTGSNKIVKLDNAQPFRVSAYEESFIVSAIKGSNYYVLLANGQQVLLYGIDLQSNDIFINGYTPNSNVMYMYALTYDIKSDQLVAFSSMNYDATESNFDVVLIDASTGEISQNLTIGNSFPNDTWYSGLYTSSSSNSELYVLYQSMDEQTNNTISGITTVSTIDGTFISNVWINSTNNFIYSFVMNEQTNEILATMSQYNGGDLQLVSINPKTGSYSIINSDKNEICAGSGPVLIDSILYSPGKTPKPSHSIYFINPITGEIIKEEIDILSNISYLSTF